MVIVDHLVFPERLVTLDTLDSQVFLAQVDTPVNRVKQAYQGTLEFPDKVEHPDGADQLEALVCPVGLAFRDFLDEADTRVIVASQVLVVFQATADIPDIADHLDILGSLVGLVFLEEADIPDTVVHLAPRDGLVFLVIVDIPGCLDGLVFLVIVATLVSVEHQEEVAFLVLADILV